MKLHLITYKPLAYKLIVEKTNQNMFRMCACVCVQYIWLKTKFGPVWMSVKMKRVSIYFFFFFFVVFSTNMCGWWWLVGYVRACACLREWEREWKQQPFGNIATFMCSPYSFSSVVVVNSINAYNFNRHIENPVDLCNEQHSVHLKRPMWIRIG